MECLKDIPDQSIQCVVTSPPYWGLRDYNVSGQLGLEESSEEFVDNLVKVFRQIKRVLKDDGTLWLNLGDTYASNGYKAHKTNLDTKKDAPSAWSSENRGFSVPKTIGNGIKEKDLVGVPWRVAFALQADGWYLRQDIIWHKPNPMPESVKDRCTKSHEYIFLLSKSQRYYYDSEAIKEKSIYPEGPTSPDKIKAVDGIYSKNLQKIKENKYRNKRSVWKITTKPFKEAHFATFPPELPELCIKAGSKENDIVLDPFFGSGTTGWVAQRLGRKWLGVELNPEYIKIAEKRFLQQELFP